MGVMNFEVGGHRIAILEDNDRMVLHVNRGDGYEAESLRCWAGLVRRGTVSLDVGAYTGLYSIIAAKLGAEVVALEPMPANRWRLGINADLNKVRITALSVAASDREGWATLHYNPKVPLTTGASLEAGQSMHGDEIQVRTLAIDALALTNVATIKIDVERHELAVLRGAMQTIDRYKPSMIIETLDDEMRNDILKLLPAYEAAAILDGRNTLFKPR